MTTQVATLIAAGVAAVASIGSLLINSSLIKNRERRQQLWRYDLENVRGVEALAGRITECLGGYKNLNGKMAEVNPLVAEFQKAMGTLLRHNDLNKAMREFLHSAAIVVKLTRDSQDVREEMKNLHANFRKLITACDQVLNRPSLK